MNSRLDTLQAAILLPKLALLNEEMALRQQVTAHYNDLFTSLESPVIASEAWQSMPPVVLPYIEPHNISAWAQYTIRVQNRDAVQEKLKKAGIPTAVHYPFPLNKQPAVADNAVQLPRGDEAAQQVISLPMHPYLNSFEQSTVVQAIVSAQ